MQYHFIIQVFVGSLYPFLFLKNAFNISFLSTNLTIEVVSMLTIVSLFSCFLLGRARRREKHYKFESADVRWHRPTSKRLLTDAGSGGHAHEWRWDRQIVLLPPHRKILIVD